MAKRKKAADEPDAAELARRDNQRLARIAALAAQADGTAVKKGHVKPLNSQRRRANARKRRSAARSARHHAQLQLQVYRTALAVLFVCRLRRMRRLRADLADLESLEGEAVNDDSGAAQVPAPSYALASLKRADRPSSSASSSSSSYASSSASAPVAFYQGGCPPMLMQLAGQEQRSGSRPRLKRPAPPYAGRM